MRGDVFFWAAVALLLVAAEVMAPGAFMLWLAFAAAALFVLVWLVPGIPIVLQAILFGVLSNFFYPFPESLGIKDIAFGYFSLLFSLMDVGTGAVMIEAAMERAETDARDIEKAVKAALEIQGPDLRFGTDTAVAQIGSLTEIVAQRARD